MSFRLCTLRVWQATVILVVSGLLVYSAQAAGRKRGRAIEFSVPRSDEVTTNLNQLTSKKDGLKQLEEDLYKPLQSFSPRSSLEGVVAPLARPPSPSAIQSKRAKEQLDRRKNWVFMTPEDMLGGPTVDEILNTPQLGSDVQEKKELPTFERYYRRMTAKRSAANNPGQLKAEDLFGFQEKTKPQDERAVHEEPDLPSGLRESAETLNKLFDPASSDSPLARGGTRSSFADTFGLGAKSLSKEQVQEHKKFLDEYRSVLDPSWRPAAAATPGNPFATEAGAAPLAGRPSAGLPSVPSQAPHRGLEAQLDVVHPLLGPAGLPDLNAHAVGQTRPTLALPRVEPPRVAPAMPTFVAPTRSFH